jgi:hypothetical protein
MKALYRISNSRFTAILKLLADEALPENMCATTIVKQRVF